MLQSLKSVVLLWVMWSFCAGCEVSNLFVGAYPRISAPWSVWWHMSRGVRALNYLTFEVSDLLVATCPGCEVCNLLIGICPRMWIPWSVCRQCLTVWTVWGVHCCEPECEVSDCVRVSAQDVRSLIFLLSACPRSCLVSGSWWMYIPGCEFSELSGRACSRLSVFWGLGMYFQAYEISGLFADIYVCRCLYI